MTHSSTVVKVQWVDIHSDQAGRRIDNFLLMYLKGVPRALVYRILRKGEVRVNKGRVKPEYKLQRGDRVRIPPVRVASARAPAGISQGLAKFLAKAVIYEDKDVMVMNKPSGLAVHGGSGVTLGLIESLRQLRDERFLELVHRLDRDTSGCVMVAKSRGSLRYLQQQLRDGKITKIYRSLVIGHWPVQRTHIDVPLLKNQLVSGERIVRAVADGVAGAKPSRTEFRVLEHYTNATLLEVRPITGRTHQIRVHCQTAGHSIIGDDKYGDCGCGHLFRDLGFKRLCLHASQLNFVGYSGKTIRVVAQLDSTWRLAQAKLTPVMR